MTDLRTISPDELPVLSEIPEDLHAVVFSPAGPLQAVPYEKLLSKLIAANLAKTTKAALDADLAHAADSVALVFNDPTAALNGWYRKLGASGAGSWSQFEELARNSRILAQGAAAIAQSAAAAALAAAGVNPFVDVPAGLASVAFGDTFYVVAGGVGTIYRKDAGPTATQIGKFLIDPTANGAAGLLGAVGGTVQQQIDARPTSATLAAGGGAELIGMQGTSATKATQTLAVHIRECEVRVTLEGAVGNAVANDATPIQNAIAEAELIAATKGGCDLVLPPGAYRINSGLRVRRDRLNLIFKGGAKLLPYGSFDTLTFQSATAATFIYQNNLVEALFEETNKTGGKALVGKYLAEAQFDLTAFGGFDGIQLDTFNTIDLDARVTNLTSASAIYCLARGGGSVGARSDVLRLEELEMGGTFVDGQQGLVIDGFVHTIDGENVYGINIGGRVLETRNSIGAADTPAFLTFWSFQTDYQKAEAIYLGEGKIAEFVSCTVNGSRTTSNIFVGANFKDARFLGGRSTGAAQAGIAIAGVDTLVDGMTCKFNSSDEYTGTLGAFPGIVVGGTSSGARIKNCRSGDPDTATYQSSGIQIDTGANNFIVKDNDVRNNVGSGVVNGAGTGPTRIVADNMA